MKTKILLLTCFLCSQLTGCKPKVSPISERIAKIWTAQTVREGSTLVYTKGANANIRSGYVNFKLDLSSATSVTLTEWDNNRFTGQWELQNDTKLILKNLTPQPTGTNGTIEFSLSDFMDNTMKLARTTASVKTGNTINSYELVNP
jgi:hypothetical protein